MRNVSDCTFQVCDRSRKILILQFGIIWVVRCLGLIRIESNFTWLGTPLKDKIIPLSTPVIENPVDYPEFAYFEVIRSSRINGNISGRLTENTTCFDHPSAGVS